MLGASEKHQQLLPDAFVGGVDNWCPEKSCDWNLLLLYLDRLCIGEHVYRAGIACQCDMQYSWYLGPP